MIFWSPSDQKPSDRLTMGVCGMWLSMAWMLRFMAELIRPGLVYPEGDIYGYNIVYDSANRKRSENTDCLILDSDCKPGSPLYKCCHSLDCCTIARIEGYSFEVL